MTLRTFHQPGASPLGPGAGFTLVEVILAIVIAVGILLVLLYFYEQATNLRTQAIQESERISAARLFLDRFTGELRTAQPLGFVGTSNSIQFVKTDVPSFASWTGGSLGRSAFPVTDLTTVRYRLEMADGTNVTGLFRSEEPLVAKMEVVQQDQLGDTNSVTSLDNPLPVIEEIRFLQLRYWAGTNWQEEWNSTSLPESIEVTLGPEASTNELELVELAPDLFRRIIYLPGSRVPRSTGSPRLPSLTNASPAETEEVP